MSGNVEKQTTIQGNMQNLMIQHVSSQPVKGNIHGIVLVGSPPELQVHVPLTRCIPPSVSVMQYRQRQRIADKKIVTLKRSVDTKKIPGPVPVTEQIDGFYYCNKCDKKFKDKIYFQTHLRRLCRALENPEAIKCPKCDKLFHHYKSFKQHKQVHDSIK